MDLIAPEPLDPAVAADPARYRIGGLAPIRVARPASEAEAIEEVRAAARDRLALVPWGGGIALAHEPAPARYDVALDLGGLAAIVDHQPEDLTLIAQAGTPLATLRAACEASAQALPLEAAFAGRARFGGVLAANASGPRRRRFGAPRDRVLGARFVTGEGVAARSGGRVVKNVAGHGIQRLLCGSRGGLAVMLEAAIKLAPAPAMRLALAWELDLGRLGAAWPALFAREPAAASVVRGFALPALPGARTLAIAVLEDDVAWVREQERAFTNALGAADARAEGAGAAEWLEWLADLEEAAGPRLSFTTAETRPEAIAALPGDTPLVFHAPAGRLHAFPAATPAAAVTRAAEAGGFTLLDARGAGAIEAMVAPEHAVLALRRSLRAAFDPGGVFALGDRWVDAPDRVEPQIETPPPV